MLSLLEPPSLKIGPYGIYLYKSTHKMMCTKLHTQKKADGLCMSLLTW